MENKQDRVVFISGKLVNLRPIEKSDIPALTRWVNDPAVRQFITTIFPINEHQEEGWFNRLGEGGKDAILLIETKDGIPIGNMGIHGIRWNHGTATTGAIIGEKEYWGKGYGTDAKMHLLEYAFDMLNLRKVKSLVYAFNERSVNYSLRCGYKIEGRLRAEHWHAGKYHDVIQLAIFREDWLRVWKRYRKTGRVR